MTRVHRSHCKACYGSYSTRYSTKTNQHTEPLAGKAVPAEVPGNGGALLLAVLLCAVARWVQVQQPVAST